MAHITADPCVTSAPFRAPDSLTQQHVAMVLQAVKAEGGAWQVDQHEDYLGHLTIVVAALDGGREAPTLIVSGRVRHIELASMYGDDDLCECGCFSTIEAVMTALVVAMSSISVGEGDNALASPSSSMARPTSDSLQD